MIAVPTLVNTRDFGYVSIPPRFESHDFGSWKERMLLHIVGVEPYLMTILTKGPYVPILVTRTPGATTDAPEIVTELIKPQVQWTDDERRLVNLDARLRNLIINTLPDDIMKSVIKLSFAKKVWDNLCTRFDGTEDVLAAKKIDLNRAYEGFFSLPNENLDGTYNRFKCLLNDMTNAGIEHDILEVCHKFIDSLPIKWQGLRQILHTTKQLKMHDLESLYGTLQFEERALAQNLRAKAESKSSSSTPSHLQDLVNDLDIEERQEMFSDFMQFAFIAGKRYSKKWNSRKSTFSQKPVVDKSQEECWRCGRKDHYKKECNVSIPSLQAAKPSSFSSARPSSVKPADEYKKKYYELRAKMADVEEAKLPAKSLVAEQHDWADSDESEADGEEYVDAICLMALADDQALTKDQVCSSQWVNVTIKKFVESIRADLKTKLNSVSAELSNKNDKLKDLRNVHVELESQKLLNHNLQKSNEELKNKVVDLEKIVISWSKASKLHDQIFNKLMPTQIKAIIGGD
uniref:uncharacterized protein LOC122604283 n=1 Tax=Erigeron canadensis TaxID=72917 RepID=UPI001CB9C6A0|nr:uncharacterized protein LOC122604283 [Erigeron canadensis]